MRIIRHLAPDTRQALRAVREQLGEDAVILSSRRTSEGVEVTAAVDFNAEQLQAGDPGTSAAPPPAPPTEWVSPAAAPRALLPDMPAATEVTPDTALPPVPAPPEDLARQAPTLAAAPAMDLVNHELKILRRMLETQLEQLAWDDRTRRTPVIAEMLRELTELGLAPELAERITQQLPERVDLANARRFALTALSQYLLVTGPRWLEDGGRLAFLGATGVGKTTSLAKIAVRWVLRHGARDLALVAADSVRIGAHDQLQALGQLLGAPVFTPESFNGLGTTLSQLARFRLVLIDTPGASVRDPQLSARLAVLANSASQLESALVLPANAQAGALEEAVKRFAPANPACCLLTKIDEATSLGGSLSVLVRSRLPLAFVSEGQRIPEDLQPARALDLIAAAVRLAKATNATADEDLLRRRFGKVAHVLT
jgi:flagellar biosynthesis protein FlhF